MSEIFGNLCGRVENVSHGIGSVRAESVHHYQILIQLHA